MPIQRLARLSDIIFAVAMTILAIVFAPVSVDDISPDTAAQVLWQQLPGIGIYALTFITLAFYWFTHVHQFKYCQKTDAVHTFLTLFSLLFVVLFTYASDLLGAYEGVFAINLFYSLAAIGVGIFSTVAWIYGTRNRRLVAPDLSDETIRRIRQESYIEPSIYMLAIGTSWLVPWGWSITVTLGFPIAFLIQAALASQHTGETETASE
ncbi:MAG: TMEM175 family protein [Cyanobacteria bacterium P01_D01_bin.105]